MKKFVILMFVIAIISACNKEDSLPQWVGVGTIEKAVPTTDEFTIILDEGSTLYPNHIITNNVYENDDRIVVTYAVTETNNDNSYNVDIYDIDPILTKNIIQLTPENNDSIGNDPIRVFEDNIWISGHYLNFIFEYYGEFQSHYINLVKLFEDTHTEDGRLILEFRHNNNDDFTTLLKSGIVSFDLESLKETGLDAVDFLVKVKEYGNDTLEWEGSYTFNSALKSKGNKALLPKSTQLKITSEGLK